MSVVNLTAENFSDEVLNSNVPVLVDFYATWCGPCRMLTPIIDEIAEEYDGVKVCKVDVDTQPELAARFNVASIPTIAVFSDGELQSINAGARPKIAILQMLNL